jgi:hypothetical protein
VTHHPSSPLTSITPTEAIRRAMSALGSGSQVAEILDYIREHYGITGIVPPEPPAESAGLAREERAGTAVLQAEREEKSDRDDPAVEATGPRKSPPRRSKGKLGGE